MNTFEFVLSLLILNGIACLFVWILVEYWDG